MDMAPGMDDATEARPKISTSAHSVTVTGLPGYDDYEFVIGFNAGASDPNGVFIRTDRPHTVRLTATTLRRLPYDRLLKIAAEARVRQLGEKMAPEAGDRPYGGDEAHARAVAEVYRWAVDHSVPPRKAIAARWAKSEATAGRWITQARKQGLLPPYGEKPGG
ncbi:hypothetical protein ACIBKX_08570 [Streptomyces sp. NPDC050658]|uniref:hypothetical protein n=1 Tax=unclassified Streptomyces TaxID=2593676 RepID=UPI0034268122